MGLIDLIFKKPLLKKIEGYFKMLNGYSPVFTSYNQGVYEMELTRAAIDAFARNAAKLKPEVMGDKLKDLEVILQNKPNPLMDTYKFIYRIATILSCDNNAFIIPLTNKYDAITGFFPIAPRQCEVVSVKDVPYLRYTFGNGEKAAIELDRVGIMNQFQYRDDLFGENNKAIDATMQLLHTQNQGIIEGVRNSANIRFMAKINNVLDDKDVEKQRNNWTERNLSSSNTSGLIIYDNKITDLKQVESQQFVINAAQQKLIQENVFNYFGINAGILQNSYTDEEFTAYYEGKIEPFAVQLSLVLSNMVFTLEEIKAKSGVIMTANRLQYMKNETKLQVSSQLFDRGVWSMNEVRDMWNLPHVADGDKRYIRKEYAEVGKIDEESVKEKTDDNEG